MRWLVEVTSLGKTEKDSLYVDADSWQKALQVARTLRAETEPMTGFSIEILEEGCRAVDPTMRLRYDVHRADEVRPNPTRASAAPKALAPAEGHAEQANTVATFAPAEAAPQTRSTFPPRPQISPTATMMIGPPVARASSAAPQSAASPSIATPSSLPSQVVFKREQDATEALPLTYREYVYVVPPGSTEMAAASLVQTQLELVRASLERMPAGKLVNLAVFDVAFQGKPPVPPLATLAWKDWRGLALVTFPRQSGRAPLTIPTGAPRKSAPPPPAPAPIPQESPARAPAGPFVPARQAAPVQAPPPAPVQPPPIAFVQQPPPIAFVQQPPEAAAVQAPLPALAQAPAPPAPPVSFAPPPEAAPAQRTPVQAPSGPPVGRIHGEDLIADLFESMHDLHFSRDAVEGGDFCLALAMTKLPSLAGIVELYDINRREFLVTSTRGEGAGQLLLRRFPETDALLAAAMRKRRALVIGNALESEAATNERYVVMGGARSLIVAPVMQSGRFLGAIELLNPIDGQPFTESDGNAVTYIAEQLAEFVAARGIVTDPARISARPGASSGFT